VAIEYTGSVHFALNLEPLDQSIVPPALKHCNASIRLSPGEKLSRVMNLLALLKARSHSQDIVGQANISKAQRWRAGKASPMPGWLHQAKDQTSQWRCCHQR
jgi:hypothetical protein